MKYKIVFETSAVRELKNLPRDVQSLLADVVDDLGVNPRPHASVKLTGVNGYRVRKGNYRILYTIDDDKKQVVIFRLGHRRDVYKGI